jgi:hypothetical protein
MSEAWRDSIKRLELIREGMASRALGSELARQSQLAAAAAAAQRFTNIDQMVADSLRAANLGRIVWQSMETMTSAYRAWMEEIAVEPVEIVSLPPSCLVFPQIEVFNEAAVLVDVEADEEEEVRDERARLRGEIAADMDKGRTLFLQRGFGDLIPLLDGALDAALHQGPDHSGIQRVRCVKR